jgi:hypothetical protein
MPHWFLAILFASVAAVPWLPRKFSLRTLLIAIAWIAVALGIVATGWLPILLHSALTSDVVEHLRGLMPLIILAVPLSLLGICVSITIYMSISMIVDRRENRTK